MITGQTKISRKGVSLLPQSCSPDVLIVEDELHISQALRILLQEAGFTSWTVTTLGELRLFLEKHIPDIVLLDIKLPDGDGLSAIPSILKLSPITKIIVITAFGDTSLVVRAIQKGAYNFLDKPFSPEILLHVVQHAAETLRYERSFLLSPSGGKQNIYLGKSPEILEVLRFTQKVTEHKDINILIQGESGVGKEVIANYIHEISKSPGKFVGINCAAIPESLLEAELFGYKKGAYTGALADKEGLIQHAREGTLFLDEIGDMPQNLQVKLLRFLDSRSYRSIGSVEEKHLSLRIICATSQNLEEKVADKTFRQDLYYRIATLPLEIPPLRKRREDILPLALFFISEYSKKTGLPPKTFSEDVQEVFQHYPWPGNVRELKNITERIFILKDPQDFRVRLSDLPKEMLDFAIIPEDSQNLFNGPNSLYDVVEQVEKKLIEKTLRETEGNKSEAARRLGISRYSLLRKLQKWEEEA